MRIKVKKFANIIDNKDIASCRTRSSKERFLTNVWKFFKNFKMLSLFEKHLSNLFHIALHKYWQIVLLCMSFQKNKKKGNKNLNVQ